MTYGDIRPESVVDEVAGYHLVEKALPVAMSPWGRKALDLPSHLGPVLHHLALDVKLERFLPEVGINDLARSLERNFNELWFLSLTSYKTEQYQCL